MRPFRECFVYYSRAAIGEGKAAGKEFGGSGLVAGAVFVVTHQGEATAGKLDADLMAAAGVQTDVNKTGFSGRWCRLG